jgi:pimeloyl-ACP methyl ester carboxylesterase
MARGDGGTSPTLRGERVDIGGRRLHVVREAPVAGRERNAPLVILEAGAFGLSADWAVTQTRLARAGFASLAYDRAGLGASDPGPKPRDSKAIVDDLEALLAALKLPGPFIVAGHSMAGLHTRLFAVRDRTRVAGLVLVDATTPEASAHPVAAGFITHFGTLSNWAATGAGLGLFRPLMGTALGDAIGLPPDASSAKREAFASGPHNRSAADEALQWAADAQQVEAAGPLDPALPVAVITAGAAKGRAGWKALQTAPADAAEHGYVEHVRAATHASLLGPRFADAVVRGVAFVAEAADEGQR